MGHLSFQNVTKVFAPDVRAVEGFSLDIDEAEFIVLVGPSGCGKSTTLRMLAGLEEITSGQITLDGRVINNLSPKNRDIAMVFQSYALYPHMTVAKNMAFALKLRRVPRKEIRQRVQEAAGILGIDNLLDRRPRELSGGQRQRVALGRAIVRDPAAFLFDEPLSNLDAKLRVDMRAELKRLHNRLGRTTLYVTHDQEEAMTLGDRIVVMSDGVIQQAGPPLEVFNRPANRFVAGFVGTPPMNFIDGRLEAADGGLIFTDGSDRVKIPPSDRDRARLADCTDRPVVLGVRPEALGLRAEGRFAGADSLSVRLEVVEPLGEKMDLLGRTQSGHEIVARVDAEAGPSAGSELHLYLDPARLHLFEPGPEGRALR